MDAMTTGDTETLIRIVQQRLESLEQLAELVARQEELIEQQQVSGLMTVLAAKQRVLGRLTDLEMQLDPFREEDPDQRVWSSVERRQQCAAALERGQRLIRELLERERTSEQQLSAQRDAIGRRIDGAHAAQAARNAYQPGSGSARGSLDLSSGK